MGLLGEFLSRIFGPFEFDDIELTLPTETFDGELTLRVGAKQVRLVEVGPAHTRGDTIVVVPADRVVYTADILFAGGHPIMWEGPVENWLRALGLVLTLEVDTVVPGHGPVTDKRAVAALRDYFTYLDREARARFDAGMSAMDAALDISLADFASWGEAERVVANVRTLYRWYSGGERATAPELLGEMAEWDRRRTLSASPAALGDAEELPDEARPGGAGGPGRRGGAAGRGRAGAGLAIDLRVAERPRRERRGSRRRRGHSCRRR